MKYWVPARYKENGEYIVEASFSDNIHYLQSVVEKHVSRQSDVVGVYKHTDQTFDPVLKSKLENISTIYEDEIPIKGNQHANYWMAVIRSIGEDCVIETKFTDCIETLKQEVDKYRQQDDNENII